jgi:hypothetical protein
LIAVTLDDPVVIVGPLKVQEGLAQVLDGGEVLHPEEVFLEDADKALGAAVAFRGPDKGRRTRSYFKTSNLITRRNY